MLYSLILKYFKTILQKTFSSSIKDSIPNGQDMIIKESNEDLPVLTKLAENLNDSSKISYNSQIQTISASSIEKVDSVSQDHEDQHPSKCLKSRKSEELYELLGIDMTSNKLEPSKSSDKKDINSDQQVNDFDLDDIIKPSEESSIAKETESELVTVTNPLSEIPEKPTSKATKRKSSSNKKDTKLNISTSSDDLDVIFTESVTNSNASNETCTRSLRSRTSSLRRMY